MEFSDFFQSYSYITPVKHEDIFTGEKFIIDWADNISSEGIPIVKSNLPTENNKLYIEKPKAYFNPVFKHPIVTQKPLQTIPKTVKNHKSKALQFFIDKGLNPIHAAGIVGNLYGESSLKHTAVNSSSKAYGLAQWLGSRKKSLIRKYGNNPTFDQQLEFLWEELNTTEKSAFRKLLMTQSVEEATKSFMRNFERPSEKEMRESISRRTKYAKSLLT